MENKRTIDAEKILSYILITATVLAAIIYIADIKERIAKLEVHMEYQEHGKKQESSSTKARSHKISL